MNVRAIQTGEVQIKSRHVQPRFSARPARQHAHRRSTALLRELCGRHRVVVAPSHDPDTPGRLAAVDGRG